MVAFRPFRAEEAARGTVSFDRWHLLIKRALDVQFKMRVERLEQWLALET